MHSYCFRVSFETAAKNFRWKVLLRCFRLVDCHGPVAREDSEVRLDGEGSEFLLHGSQSSFLVCNNPTFLSTCKSKATVSQKHGNQRIEAQGNSISRFSLMHPVSFYRCCREDFFLYHCQLLHNFKLRRDSLSLFYF